MLCQRCGKKNATVHISKITNNKKVELHLCEDCANQINNVVLVQPSSVNMDMGIPVNLLTSLINNGLETSYNTNKTAVRRCNICGMTYENFIKYGKFGCENCYKVFGDMLDRAFEKIHGSSTYKGKIPQNADKKIKTKREIDILKDELKRAVSQEKYEKAAELRDEIKSLEYKIKGND